MGANSIPEAVKSALARVRLLALDVDGTLTDGRVVYVGDDELQAFCVRDGQGLVWLTRAGVELTWITGRGCAATEKRARELGVDELHMRAGSKTEVLAGVQDRLRVSVEETIAMGDDLPDLGLAERAAVFVAPANAHAEVRERAAIVTAASAGHGAVRELAELILRAKGVWSEVVGRYAIAPE